MVGGQALDLAAEGTAATLAQVRAIHRRKTGALLVASVRIGGIVGGAGATLLGRLTAYGTHLGLAFQIADDLLDAREAGEADGRTDRELEKATYPAALGVDGAWTHAARERDAALAAIARLGPRAEPLRQIVAHVVERARPPGQRRPRRRTRGAPARVQEHDRP